LAIIQKIEIAYFFFSFRLIFLVFLADRRLACTSCSFNLSLWHWSVFKYDFCHVLFAWRVARFHSRQCSGNSPLKQQQFVYLRFIFHKFRTNQSAISNLVRKLVKNILRWNFQKEEKKDPRHKNSSFVNWPRFVNRRLLPTFRWTWRWALWLFARPLPSTPDACRSNRSCCPPTWLWHHCRALFERRRSTSRSGKVVREIN